MLGTGMLPPHLQTVLRRLSADRVAFLAALQTFLQMLVVIHGLLLIISLLVTSLELV